MKLKRCYNGLFDSTEGIWESNTGGWLFCQGEFYPYGAEHISTPDRSWFIAPASQIDYKTKEKLLKTYGLWDTPFKTRREAVQALDAMLEGMPS